MKLFKSPLLSRNLFSTLSNQQSKKQSILLTGLQPTGSLHLGNYFGSVVNVLKYQNNPDFQKRFVFIADLHSLTNAFKTDHDSIKLDTDIGKDTFQMVKTLIACGVDPQKTTLFVQSHVPQHSELAWILSCFINQRSLDLMIQFKQKGNENTSVGLYTYPVLMSSDILIYRATHVPVGADQVQHLQLTNKIRERFNRVVRQEYFPKASYVEARKAKIMSLVDPDKKMSKSDRSEKSRISLKDNLRQIQSKIRKATTDAEGFVISYDTEKRKGLSNLIDLYSLLKNWSQQQVVKFAEYNKWSVSILKNQLINQIWKVLEEVQIRNQSLDDQKIKKIIEQGAQKARLQASTNIKQIKKLLRLV